MGEQGVDVGLDVPVRAPGELVAYGLVAFGRLSLVQGAEVAQHLEVVGAGRDPDGFAQFGLPGGGRGVGGQLGLDDVVGARVVYGARTGSGEQLGDALPLRMLRRATEVVGQVLVPGRLPRVEPSLLEGRRDSAGIHSLRLAPYDAAADAGRVDGLAGRRAPYGRSYRLAGSWPDESVHGRRIAVEELLRAYCPHGSHVRARIRH
ncbi:hypothetical protein ACIGD1_26015 [Streptomyces sp. NPDC085612]|uniref:hypothetical protein n=1 Tax=Streptomyces sp. NPDC085612 TaxID=3365732 RepID=UPI0037D186B9